MPQFIVVPSSAVDGSGFIQSLASAIVTAGNVITVSGGVYRAFATADVSTIFTPTGSNFTAGLTVISGASATQFLIVPDVNFNPSGEITTLANSFVTTSLSITGLLSGVAYRAVALTAPSGAIDTITVPAAFTDNQWDVIDPATGGMLNFTFGPLPYDGGSPITNVNIYQNGSGTPIQTGLTAPGNYSLSGLTNGQPYSFTAAPVNAVGVAALSLAKVKTPTSTVQPPPSLAADVTVSSLSALYSQLALWQSGWNTTTPAGKTNSDARIVGINSDTFGNMNLAGYTFPQRVYVRHVGTFTGDSAGISSCSVRHTGTGSLNNSTNIWVYLMDLRAPDTGAYNTGLWSINNTTDCGVVRCAAFGWPFTVDTAASGTTSYLFNATGSTRLTLLYNAGYYFKDGLGKLFGTHNNIRREGQMGNFYGGDDITIGAGSSIVDATWRCNFYARRRMMVPGNHNDGVQFNKSPSSTPAIRFNARYDVFLRGRWGGGALASPGESGWGAFWTNDAQGTCVGPHSFDDSLMINGHNRAITGFPGGQVSARRNTAVQHLSDQPPNAAYPAITNVATSESNFCTGHNAGYNTNPGTNGLLLVLGGTVTGSGANYNLLLPYFTNIPTNYTDLWDIRPPVGALTHPGTAGNKIGCYPLWEKLFNGDSDVVLTKQGWPVAPLFKADFDRNGGFWSGYTGNFDANGDNI